MAFLCKKVSDGRDKRRPPPFFFFFFSPLLERVGEQSAAASPCFPFPVSLMPASFTFSTDFDGDVGPFLPLRSFLKLAQDALVFPHAFSRKLKASERLFFSSP